ncbi:hypothetical protein ADUPG1_010257 [Aduncisulcus paluster]|uniref:Tyr recombinase domain-containing protein n=1 Tax=Aduncisulcus paluster TaxID=2918883 RepID=A0ABQ5JRE2_9EUKA|nr:hypothetical protein ADUPG1_010257 [Aduncisulcus paluster]
MVVYIDDFLLMSRTQEDASKEVKTPGISRICPRHKGVDNFHIRKKTGQAPGIARKKKQGKEMDKAGHKADGRPPALSAADFSVCSRFHKGTAKGTLALTPEQTRQTGCLAGRPYAIRVLVSKSGASNRSMATQSGKRDHPHRCIRHRIGSSDIRTWKAKEDDPDKKTRDQSYYKCRTISSPTGGRSDSSRTRTLGLGHRQCRSKIGSHSGLFLKKHARNSHTNLEISRKTGCTILSYLDPRNRQRGGGRRLKGKEARINRNIPTHHGQLGTADKGNDPRRWKRKTGPGDANPWKTINAYKAGARIRNIGPPRGIREGNRQYSRSSHSYLWYSSGGVASNAAFGEMDWGELQSLIGRATEGDTDILKKMVSTTQEDGTIKSRLAAHEADDVGRPVATNDRRRRMRRLVEKSRGDMPWIQFLADQARLWVGENQKTTSMWEKFRNYMEVLTGKPPSSLRRRFMSLLGRRATSTPAERYRHDAMTVDEVREFVRVVMERGMLALATWAAVTFETVSRAGSVASIRLGGIRCFRDYILLFCPSNKTKAGIMVRINKDGPVGAFDLLRKLLQKHEVVQLHSQAFLFGDIHPEKNKDPSKRLKQSFTLQSQRVIGIQTGSHALRRGAVIHLLCSGVRQEVIMSLGGWSTVEGYMAYIDRSVEDQRNARGYPLRSEWKGGTENRKESALCLHFKKREHKFMPPRRIRNARKEDEAEEDSQAEEESEESEKQPDVATNSQPGTDNQDVAKEEPEEQDEGRSRLSKCYICITVL